MTPNATVSTVKMEDLSVGKVCEELDELFMKIMDDYDQLQALYKKIAASMSSGHINIAQTRHFKGPTTVGELQYPATMVPLTKAQVTMEESSGSGSSAPRPTYHVFKSLDTSAVHVRNAPGTASAAAPQKEAESGQSSELRQRAGKGSEAEEPAQKMDAQTDGGEAKPAQKVKDPLRWFGVLVPSQLRQAQKDFKAAIETALDMATIKARLLANMDTYDKLLAQKKAAISSAEL